MEFYPYFSRISIWIILKCWFILVGSSDLVAGNHTFDFAFLLPKKIPSSLETGYGYIRYTAEVIFQRQYKRDLHYQTLFAVLSHVDLNLIPQIKVTFYV